MLNKFIEEQKLTWNNDLEFIMKLCDQIEQSAVYQEYMADAADDYEADSEIWRKLYKQLVQENEEIDDLLEEKNLYWNDDKEIADTFVLRSEERRVGKECRPR